VVLAIVLAALAVIRAYGIVVAGLDPADNAEILPVPTAPWPVSGFALRCEAVPWPGDDLVTHQPPDWVRSPGALAPGTPAAWRVTCTSVPECLRVRAAPGPQELPRPGAAGEDDDAAASALND
jgi:hypothetical protein